MSRAFWTISLRFILVSLTIAAIITLCYFIFTLVYPFLIGIIFALIFNPFVNFMKRKARFPRWLSVILSILFVLALAVTVVVLVSIEIANEINRLQQTLPVYIEQYLFQIQGFIMEDLVAFYDQFTAFYSTLDPELRVSIETQADELTSDLVQFGQNLIRNILEGFLSFLGAIPIMATAFIISLLASFFISKDWPRHSETFIKLVPAHVRLRGSAVLKDLRHAVFGFFKAQLTLISITFVIVLIGFLILRIEYASTIAIIIAVVDLLPYLGTGLVFIPWIIYLFINGQYGMVIGLSILYAIVVVQRQMMEPKILGTNVGLDPLSTLFALFVGFQLFGLIGLIVGPALMVLITALARAGVFKDLWYFIRGAEMR